MVSDTLLPEIILFLNNTRKQSKQGRNTPFVLKCFFLMKLHTLAVSNNLVFHEINIITFLIFVLFNYIYRAVPRLKNVDIWYKDKWEPVQNF